MSITSFIWANVFQDEEKFPGSHNQHMALIAGQSFVLVLIYSGWNMKISMIILSLLYLMQAIGVSYYRITKGKVSCGCFGDQSGSQLNWNLAIFNLILGVFSFAVSSLELSLNFFEGLGLLVIQLVFGLFVVIGVPDGLYAIKSVKDRIKYYREQGVDI